MIRTFLIRLLLATLVLTAVIYVGDFISVRWRMREHKQGDPIDEMTFPRVLAIPHKGNKVEYALDAVSPTVTLECVHSVFPQLGYEPCWYVKRENSSPIPMAVLPLLGPQP